MDHMFKKAIYVSLPESIYIYIYIYYIYIYIYIYIYTHVYIYIYLSTFPSWGHSVFTSKKRWRIEKDSRPAMVPGLPVVPVVSPDPRSIHIDPMWSPRLIRMVPWMVTILMVSFVVIFMVNIYYYINMNINNVSPSILILITINRC